MASNANNSAAVSYIVNKKKNPPGFKKFMKAEDVDESGELVNPLMQQLGVRILLALQENGVCKLQPRTAESNKKWSEFYDDAFYGRKKIDGSRDGDGPFSGYAPWGSENPVSSKMKPLMTKIISHFSQRYMDAAGENNPSMLEQISFLLSQDIAAAESAKSARDLASKRVSMENAAVEGGMGFSSPGHGVSLPSTDGCNTDVFDEAAQVLGQQTSSIPLNAGKNKELFSLLDPFHSVICFISPWAGTCSLG